jgi:uncharacterized protein (TIGR02246 family)
MFSRGIVMQSVIALSLAGAILALAGCSTSPSTPPNPPLSNAPMASCKVSSQAEIAALFERWNKTLISGEPKQVLSNYAEDSVLLPTMSNVPRLTPAAKQDYFEHFLLDRPSGKIDSRTIQLGCNSAVDIGLYTFTFAKTGVQVHARYTYTYKWDGQQWLISSHHSSGMPEK